ncbi:hypothetical protein ACLBX9_21280 [Methylobacterium sp. A49B]|uniref:Uncharacterized protein n=1 Tax=Methylobacterium mesophilicum SR1.6/6 TaxID=908290 RepID=A0A6B9FMA6_9HYPH|nr:hypothetical protein [Methylobacterium mesophilicum]QGY03720.1 hypothetical protein MMSR116_18820 [Methylobacterium mesophilicum SR1.6/6]
MSIFPTARRDGAHMCRLALGLSQAHDGGIDLGSRLPHIHAGAQDLMVLAEKLRAAVETIETDDSTASLFGVGLLSAIHMCIANVQKLAVKSNELPNQIHE